MLILFPFNRVNKGSRVVIYGAGDVGQTFIHEIQHMSYCEIAGWIDRVWNEADNLKFPQIRISDLADIEYDAVVIAVTNRETAAHIKEMLIGAGVDSAKIIFDENYVMHYPLVNYSAIFKNDAHIKKSSKQDRSLQLKVGFIAPGNISRTMAETFTKRFTGAILYAVASRDENKAKEFAEKYGFAKYYGDYQQLFNDKEIELVYIASPVAYHYEHSMRALRSGKNVLCEKPFAVNSRQTTEMISYAEVNKLFITDGLWNMYLPIVQELKKILNEGVIGTIHSVMANQHYQAINSIRLNDHDLCGGVLLECGSYLLSFVMLVLGKEYKDITAVARLNASGCDIQESVILEYDDAIATINCSTEAISDRKGYIYGEKGYIIVEDANEFRKIVVHDDKGKVIRTIESESGYQYEIDSCIKAISNGELQAGVRSHDDIISLMNLLDSIRNKIKVIYKPDEE